MIGLSSLRKFSVGRQALVRMGHNVTETVEGIFGCGVLRRGPNTSFRGLCLPGLRRIYKAWPDRYVSRLAYLL